MNYLVLGTLYCPDCMQMRDYITTDSSVKDDPGSYGCDVCDHKFGRAINEFGKTPQQRVRCVLSKQVILEGAKRFIDRERLERAELGLPLEGYPNEIVAELRRRIEA